MAQAKNKLEILWQDFEKTGSVDAYLSYFQSAKTGSKDVKKDVKRNSTKSDKTRR